MSYPVPVETGSDPLVLVEEEFPTFSGWPSIAVVRKPRPGEYISDPEGQPFGLWPVRFILPRDWAGTDTADGLWEARLPGEIVEQDGYRVPLYEPPPYVRERLAWEAYRRERGLRLRRRWCL